MSPKCIPLKKSTKYSVGSVINKSKQRNLVDQFVRSQGLLYFSTSLSENHLQLNVMRTKEMLVDIRRNEPPGRIYLSIKLPCKDFEQRAHNCCKFPVICCIVQKHCIPETLQVMFLVHLTPSINMNQHSFVYSITLFVRDTLGTVLVK